MKTLRFALLWALVAGAAASACSTPGGTCAPETDLQFCTRQSRDCDTVVAFDNCGASRSVNCGMCMAPETCGGGGMANMCGMPGTGDGGSGGDGGPADGGQADGGCPLCPTDAYWIYTRFTLTTNEPIVNGTPYTHAFDALVGVETELRINFGSTTEMVSPMPPFAVQRTIMTGPTMSATSPTPPVIVAMAASFAGRTSHLDLNAMMGFPGVDGFFQIVGPEPATNVYSVEISCGDTGVGVDGMSTPISGSFTCASASVSLRRFGGTTSNFTDYASGTGTFEYHQP